jgi:dihydrofolate synthase/folylpolyglutamate synthase
MDLSEATAWLDGHLNMETGRVHPMGPRLDRMRQLVDLLGDPQTAYPVIHVTGTNGKTSTARIAARLLAAHGLTVGVYTSPHLVRINERMARVFGTDPAETIDDDQLAEMLTLVASVEPLLEAAPSWFELTTAAAFAWFADVAVDVAVIEVGLGGRWDATNVVDGTVAVVTNVAIDHVEYIGPDRESIAEEKSGIVKPDSVLVLGEGDPAIAPILEAPEHVATVRRGEDFGVLGNAMAHGGRLVDLFGAGGDYHDLFLPLHGRHQAENASIALAATEQFFGGHRLDDDLVAGAFAAVRSPGRLEVVRHGPLVLLDGAHNVHGAEALARALDEEFPAEERTLVVGLLREKDPRAMLTAMRIDRVARLVACRPPTPRALDPAEIAEAAVDLGLDPLVVDVVDDPVVALDVAIERTPPKGEVVVTGSVYLVGAVRSHLVPSGSDSRRDRLAFPAMSERGERDARGRWSGDHE